MPIYLAYHTVLTTPSRKNRILYCLAIVGSLFTHYYLIIVIFIQAAHIFIASAPHRTARKKIILVQALAAGTLLPWLIPVITDPRWARGTLAWLEKPTPFSFVHTIASFFAGNAWHYARPPFIAATYTHWAYILFCILCAVAVFRCREKIKNTPNTVITIAYLAGPLALLYLFSTLVFSVYHIRYMISSVLAFYLLIAWCAVREKRKILTIAIIVFFVAVNAGSFVHYFTQPVRAQHREAAAYLAATALDGEIIASHGYADQTRLLQFYRDRFGGTSHIAHVDHKTPIDIGKYDWFVFVWKDPRAVDNRLCLEKAFFGVSIFTRCQR